MNKKTSANVKVALAATAGVFCLCADASPLAIPVKAVAEKLALGIKLRITDAVNDADMVKCPECGMLNPQGSMYCLDCGAEI